MKKILLLLMASFISISAMAWDLAGKTYKWFERENGAWACVTFKFTADQYTFTATGTGISKKTRTGKYEINGNVITCYIGDFDQEYLYIDSEECIYNHDAYGNRCVDMMLVKTPAKSSKKSSGKKRK